MTTLDLLPRLLYRDAMMLIIDKPAGIPVHKGTGGGENLEQAFEQLRFGLPRLPALAHRLDRDTSGCLVLGRHRQALAKLAKLFEHQKVEKTYFAIVRGAPPEPSGVISLPLEKQSADSRRWHMRVAPPGTGLPCVTHYEMLGQSGDMTWLALSPKTGRTHQLRVHCAAMGFPILGDRVYAPETASFSALMLHSRAVNVPFSANKPPICAVAPAPAHMQEALRACGFSEKP